MQFVGELQLFPYGFAPIDWTLCDGKLLSINDYSTLFALIGTTFGGDGMTNFAVPDLRKATIGQYNQYYIALNGIFPPRN